MKLKPLPKLLRNALSFFIEEDSTLNLKRFGTKKAKEGLRIYRLPIEFPRSHLIWLLMEQTTEIEKLEAENLRLTNLLSNMRRD